jgi:hypothetical protein
MPMSWSTRCQPNPNHKPNPARAPAPTPHHPHTKLVKHLEHLLANPRGVGVWHPVHGRPGRGKYVSELYAPARGGTTLRHDPAISTWCITPQTRNTLDG